MAAGYFADGRYYEENGHLLPFDIRFDPTDRAFCNPRPDGSVHFRLITEAGCREANLVLADGTGVPMRSWAEGERFTYWETVFLPARRAFSYTFALRDPSGRAVYYVPAGIGNAVERLDRWTLDLDVSAPLEVPAWARGAVIYQIFPERFRSGDPELTPPGAEAWGSEPHWLRFQGGDLAGIAEKAPYLAELGVDMVYINPIFASPSTHRYDAIDYYRVDDALGGNDALRRLVSELHERQIRLIVDASFNHCSPRFFAFADLLEKGTDSPYRDWFVVREWPPRVKLRRHVAAAPWVSGDAYQQYLAKLTETDGISVEVAGDDGPAVETTYESWYGVPSLPRVNLANPEARAYFLDVAAHWIREFNIDGWRMDVARYVDPDFWPEFRRVCKTAKRDAYLIAEVMGDASPWLQGDAFDATMNYTFRELCLDYFATRTIGTAAFLDGFTRMLAMYAPEVTEVNQNLLSSHDTARFLHEAGDDRSRVVPAVIFQLTVPGAPGIYYGDEVGMTGGEEPSSRGAFPWDEPETWDGDLLGVVRALTALRRAHPALRHGSWRAVWSQGDAFAFIRSLDEEEILVLVNRGEALSRVVLPVESGNPVRLWGTGSAAPAESGLAIAGISAAGGLVVKL